MVTSSISESSSLESASIKALSEMSSLLYSPLSVSMNLSTRFAAVVDFASFFFAARPAGHYSVLAVSLSPCTNPRQ